MWGDRLTVLQFLDRFIEVDDRALDVVVSVYLLLRDKIHEQLIRELITLFLAVK